MNDDERAIRDLVATWLRATRAGETGKVLALMTEDVVFLTPGRPPMIGRDAYAQAQAGLGDVDIEATSDVREVLVHGDWASAWSELSIVVTPRGAGEPVRRAGHTLSVFRREGGNWRLARDANLLMAVR